MRTPGKAAPRHRPHRGKKPAIATLSRLAPPPNPAPPRSFDAVPIVDAAHYLATSLGEHPQSCPYSSFRLEVDVPGAPALALTEFLATPDHTARLQLLTDHANAAHFAARSRL